MTDNQNPDARAIDTTRMIPLRCTVCGKTIICCYPEAYPDTINATCSSGHKIKIRKEDFLRKAV